jgi:hypothetical protein
MLSKFITIATTNFEAEAEAMALLLRNEKIDAIVTDANAVMVNWFWAPAMGYIKVQVPSEQLAAAREVLRKHPRTHRSVDDGVTRCLACGAVMPEDADRCPACGWTFKLGADTDEPDAPPGPWRWDYTVPYEPDISAALEKLKQRVFDSGEYSAGDDEAETPAEAAELAGEQGTRSILDIEGISDKPAKGFVSPLKPGELAGYFGTEQPTREDVMKSDDFRADLERGQARYVALYENGRPTEILFAGCSFE